MPEEARRNGIRMFSIIMIMILIIILILIIMVMIISIVIIVIIIIIIGNASLVQLGQNRFTLLQCVPLSHSSRSHKYNNNNKHYDRDLRTADSLERRLHFNADVGQPSFERQKEVNQEYGLVATLDM